MPKKSGEAMPPLKHQPPLRPPSRGIKSFDAPVPPGGAPKHADQIKPSENHESGNIDPTQQHN